MEHLGTFHGVVFYIFVKCSEQIAFTYHLIFINICSIYFFHLSMKNMKLFKMNWLGHPTELSGKIR